MTDDDVTRTEGEGATVDLPGGVGGIAPGQVLGERYQVLELLGRGGMGEVWHAFDLKLRVEVALKALRPEFFASKRRLEMLRDEVRAAREVVSPNVCRIFDLIEVDGLELVSMEYVDGATLLGVLQERGPLELKEAQDIASQFLAGLEAIHKAGLIHRDIKPENIMLTRAGRVVVMDFGLARQEAEGGGSVSGTPAYMAPEQAAGQTLDARADVYAAGVVLAEMVSPDGLRDLTSRQSVWEAVRSEPAKLPDTPWAQVIKRAVAKDREGRFNSAHTLTRALEDVTLRVEGAEDLHPYPGLASFTEADAEYFFGREAEVEQMWRKLEGPPRMLGLVGPSGAGKSSFLRAGLIPAATSGWATTICTPGTNPVLGLSRALAASLAGDSEAVDLLLRFDDPETAIDVVNRWRRRSGRAVLIVDQFEELFTQNGAEVQQRFTELLERLVLEADTHVLLSMRDDFLLRCREHDGLAPLFADLTALLAPTGAALRRALTQPALQCGYRFEDDELVDEMLAEVEGERGALPLLAFAAARLWEKRDRETGLLTRQAYQDIGGVGGALARHAEATIDQIGHERLPVVRELFRNLVTAEGTRAVREWNELLSIFRDSSDESHAAVLRSLIDARLLTSYEVREEDREPTRRVEIIHESLLANWPRLVRWQTQDQEGAQLRDELRQAARAWDEHGRHDDRLWTGTTFREYALWRERYPGGLSELEEAFANAMTSQATRRKRRRRVAATAAVVAALVIAAVFGALWRRSIAQERRAEAATLLSLGQLRLGDDPTATVAYVTAALALNDSQEARRLALEALWKGPTAFIASDEPSWEGNFSPDGKWLVQSIRDTPGPHLRVFAADGSSRLLEKRHSASWVRNHIAPTSEVFVSFNSRQGSSTINYVLWSLPEGKAFAEAVYDKPVAVLSSFDLSRRRLVQFVEWEGMGSLYELTFEGIHRLIGTLDVDFRSLGEDGGVQAGSDSLNGRWLAVIQDGRVSVVEIGEDELSDPVVLGRHEGSPAGFAFDPLGRYLATASRDGEIRLWDPQQPGEIAIFQGPSPIRYLKISDDGSLLEATSFQEERKVSWIWEINHQQSRLLRRFSQPHTGGTRTQFNPVGRRFLAASSGSGGVLMWSLNGPADAEPQALVRGLDVGFLHSSFHPEGTWLATGEGYSGLSVWPLTGRYPAVIRRHPSPVYGLVFEPHGRWLASSGYNDGEVWLWPLEGDPPPPGHHLYKRADIQTFLAVSPDSRQLLVGGWFENSRLVSLTDGSKPLVLPGVEGETGAVAFSGDDRLAAGLCDYLRPGGPVIQVWDAETGEDLSVLDRKETLIADSLEFMPDNRLLVGSETGLLRIDPATGATDVLFEGTVRRFSSSADRQRTVILETQQLKEVAGELVALKHATGELTRLAGFGDDVNSVALSPDGELVVTGHEDGAVRVGSVSAEEPHQLLGHTKVISSVAIDPRRRWVASASADGEIRLWPMPDLSKPPLHTLPRDELIAKLKTLTNLRVVRDPESSTGWKLTHDPFPGWETVPTW